MVADAIRVDRPALEAAQDDIPLKRRGRRDWSGWAATILVGCFVSLHLRFADVGLNLANVLLLVACPFAILIIFISGKSRGIRAPLFVWPDLAYGIYVIWCLISIYWSVAPRDTFVRTMILVLVWASCIAVGRLPVQTIVRSVIRWSLLFAVLSFAIGAAAPGIGFQPRSSSGFPELRGIMEHQLRLGALMSLAFGLVVLSVLNGHWRRTIHSRMMPAITIGLLIAVCMVMAIARTYTAFAILSVVLALGLSRSRWIRRLSVAAIAGVIFLVLQNADILIAYAADQGVDVTLSGRARLWQKSLDAIGDHWLLGYGYGTFLDHTFDSIWGLYRPTHPHNSFINAAFETGVVGMWLVIAFIVAQLASAMRALPSVGKYSYAVFAVIMTIFTSLTGLNYAGAPSTQFALAMLLVSAEARMRALDVRESRARRSARAMPFPAKQGIPRPAAQ